MSRDVQFCVLLLLAVCLYRSGADDLNDPTVCNFNCPSWAEAEAAMKQVRTTGVTTIRELSALTNTSYVPIDIRERHRVFPPTFEVIPECQNRVGRPGPGSIFCTLMKSAFSYPVSRQLEAVEKLYDVYHAGAGAQMEEMSPWNADIATMLQQEFPPHSHLECSTGV